MEMPVSQEEIEAAIDETELAGRAICLHSSLSSFGHVDGGSTAVINGFLSRGCTLLVPTFSWCFAVPFPPDQRIPQNGWKYDSYAGPSAGINRIFTPHTTAIDKDMGAISATLIKHFDAARGNHPICSFAAAGSLAMTLIKGQSSEDVYAPLRTLADANGMVVLAGVAIDKMTLIHLAEKTAGRNLFRRFANDMKGNPVAVEVGGCSDGFHKLYPALTDLMETASVGQSRWEIFPAAKTLHRLSKVICTDALLTHCGRSDCGRCRDAMLGGPLLE